MAISLIRPEKEGCTCVDPEKYSGKGEGVRGTFTFFEGVRVGDLFSVILLFEFSNRGGRGSRPPRHVHTLITGGLPLTYNLCTK